MNKIAKISCAFLPAVFEMHFCVRQKKRGQVYANGFRMRRSVIHPGGKSWPLLKDPGYSGTTYYSPIGVWLWHGRSL